MAVRPSWQGHLKLSLVTCPVALYNAVSPKGDVHFNLLNPDTGNRIRMVTVDAGTEEPVERKNLVKGYEISKGEYVVVTPEEIESVRLESTRTIEIERFVPAADIDRLYWDNPYYLVPDGKMAGEPFAVIREAMRASEKVALGRLVMSQRERLVALEPREDGIVATTLRTRDEVRDWAPIFGDIAKAKADPDMIQIAEKIIAQKSTDFDPSEFDDRYEDALRELIASKQKGRKIVHPDKVEATAPNDLLEALRASLGDKTTKRRAPTAPAPRRTAAATPRTAAAKKRATRR